MIVDTSTIYLSTDRLIFRPFCVKGLTDFMNTHPSPVSVKWQDGDTTIQSKHPNGYLTNAFTD